MRRFLPYLALPSLILTASLALIQCKGDGNDHGESPDPNLIKSDLTRDRTPHASAADIAELTRGNAEFAFDLYGKLGPKKANENLFFSPHTVSMAFAMTYAGARGSTAEEMAQVLHYSLPAERFHPTVNALGLALEGRGQGQQGSDGKAFRLRTASSMWGQRGTAFVPSFLDTLAVNYGAGMRVADFDREPEAARQAINQWTLEQTEERVRELLPPLSVKGGTRLVLVNAIYFNAAWNTPFFETSTRAEPFTRLDGSTSHVATMRQQADFPYFEEDGYQALELPHAGRDTSMVVVLPKAGTWASFAPAFDAALYQKIMAGLSNHTVNVWIPKFEIQGTTVSLRDELLALGMKHTFGDGADFSGMILDDGVAVQDVLHQAFVKVDEKGTEAAAATAVIIGDSSAPRPPVNVKEFHADRPFFFFVRDVPSGALLFFGRIVAP